MRKIKSGVVGLDSLVDGGLNELSTTVVIGTSGAGKTTFVTQFLRRGLEQNHDALFVSLDENQEQIIKEAVEIAEGRRIIGRSLGAIAPGTAPEDNQ